MVAIGEGLMNKVVRHFLLVSTALLGQGLHTEASSATATATMTNTVTIVKACSIAATGFTTTYDPVVANATAAQTATASVTTTCTIGASPVITLGQGANAATGSTDAVPLRRVANGGNFLNYFLYQDTGRTTVWGNTAATAPPAVTATGTPTVTTIYASIPGGQAGAVGAYTDTVVATVTY